MASFAVGGIVSADAEVHDVAREHEIPNAGTEAEAFGIVVG